MSLPVHWHPVAGLFIVAPDADFTSRGLVGAEVCHTGNVPRGRIVFHHVIIIIILAPSDIYEHLSPEAFGLLDVDKGQKTQQRHRNPSFKETWDGYVKD